MKEFNNYLGCELYKINRKKSTLIMAIVTVVIILVIMGIALLLNSLVGTVGVSSVNGNYEQQIAMLENQLEMLKTQMSSNSIYKLLYYNQAYGLEAQIKMYEYFLAEGVPAGACVAYSLGGFSLMEKFNYYTFTSIATASMMTVVICYMIVMACRNTVGEFNSGAMKMQLMRPVNRQKFFTAKWLSVYIMSEAVLLFSMIVSFVIGVIAFGGNAPDVLIIANAASVTRVSPLTALFINFILKSVKVFALLQLTMFINGICKRNALAITLNIVLSLVEIGVLVETVASFAYIGFAGFYMNLNWESALSLTGPTLRGMTLWSMIPITLVWTGIFMALSYRNFSKKEI